MNNNKSVGGSIHRTHRKHTKKKIDKTKGLRL